MCTKPKICQKSEVKIINVVAMACVPVPCDLVGMTGHDVVLHLHCCLVSMD